jgi:TonB family protein
MQRLYVGMIGGILLSVLCTPVIAQTAEKSKDPLPLRDKYTAALQEIARLKHELESAKRALDAFRNQPSNSGDNAPASDFFLAGNAYMSLKKYADAVSAFTRAIERAPQDALAFRNRGVASTSMGAYQQALNDLNKALELDAQDAAAYNYRGITHYALNNAPQATHDFTKAIELNAKLADAYNNRGIVAYQLGHYSQASKDFTSAVHLGMDLATQHLQALQEDVRQAQKRLQEAGLNPGPADGVLGQQTTTAIRQYQSARGFAVTGNLDEATRHALGVTRPALAGTASQETAQAPLRFVQQTRPEYPLVARERGWEGTVTLQLELLTNGQIGEIKVVKSSGHDILDTAAREAAKTWTHALTTPAETGGTRWANVALTFTLDKESGTDAVR